MKNKRRFRRGTSAVEFALIAFPLFALMSGSIEMGRVIMVIQSLEDAARVGCRMAILDDVVTSEVESEVDDYLAAAGISGHTTTFDPDPPTGACLWDPVTVQISVPFDNLSWIPVPQWLGGINVSGSCTMPREGNPCE